MNKFDLIETLKNEQELLLNKISKAREKGDAGTYKNLIVALRDISRLIHDEVNIMNIELKYNKLYFEVESDGTNIYYNGCIYRVKGKLSEVAKYIENHICNNKNVEIYGDLHGFGLALADELKYLGYKIKESEVSIYDFTNGRFLTRKEKYQR